MGSWEVWPGRHAWVMSLSEVRNRYGHRLEKNTDITIDIDTG